jgi:Protein of unknown function (DUF5672)
MHAAIGDFLVRTYSRPSLVHDPRRTEALVLVESRPSFWLKYVVANALAHNPDANLYVFGTPEVFDILDAALAGTYVRVALPRGFGSAADFSKLLLSREFWQTFYETFVMVFQLDCVFVRPLRVEHFAFDYIGAACGSLADPVFNGGLSLRRRTAMLDAIDLMDPEVLALPEDVAFSRTMRAHPGRFSLPTVEKACEFALESFGDIDRVIGAHGTDKRYCAYGVLRALVQPRTNATFGVDLCDV